MAGTTQIADVSCAQQRRNFQLFLGSQIASQAGTWIQYVALAWLASELTGSGAALGWITVATFGPLLVLGPWTGTLADRADKRTLLIATQVLVVGQAVALGAVVLAGVSTLTFVYLLTLGFGLLHAVENPVRRAFVAELVEKDRIPRAVSLNSAITAAGRVLGPLLAGALIAAVGIGWCFIATAVSYLLTLIGLLLVRREALHIAEAAREPGAALAGLRYSWSVPELRIALLLMGVVATFGFNHQVLIPLLADQTFEGGVGAYTFLYTAIGVGFFFGALSLARRTIDLRFLAGAIMAFALANGLVALSPNLPVAVVAAFATGTTAALFVTASNMLLQQRCAPGMRGRVMALSAMVLLGGLPIGGPIVGWIADFAGPRAGVAIGSVTALLAGAIALRHLNQRRNPNHELHPEVCVVHACDSLCRPEDFNLRRGPASEDVQEEFTWWTTEASKGFAFANRHPLISSGPNDLEPRSPQSPTQVAATSTNIPPYCGLEGERQGVAGAHTVGSAHVFVVNKVLVQIRQRANPSDAEQAGRWAGPNSPDQPPEVSALRKPCSTTLGEPFERPWKDEAGAGNGVALPQDHVGCQISCGPFAEERRCVRSELLQEIAKGKALLHVKRMNLHATIVPTLLTEKTPAVP